MDLYIRPFTQSTINNEQILIYIVKEKCIKYINLYDYNYYLLQRVICLRFMEGVVGVGTF